MTIESTRLLGMPLTFTDTSQGVHNSVNTDINSGSVTLKAIPVLRALSDGPEGLKKQQRDLDALFDSRRILMDCYATYSAGTDVGCEEDAQDSWDDNDLEDSEVPNGDSHGTDAPMSGGDVVGALNEMLLMATCDHWYRPDT